MKYAADRGLHHGAAKLALDLLEREPNTLYYHICRAQSLIELHRFEEAEDVLLRVVRSVEGVWCRAAFIELGSLERERGRLSAAVRWFRKAIALVPAKPTAYVYAAEALRNAGKLNKAEEALHQALKNPGSVEYEILLHLGIIAAARGRVEEAIRYAREALAVRPRYPFAKILLADAEGSLRVVNRGSGQQFLKKVKSAFLRGHNLSVVALASQSPQPDEGNRTMQLLQANALGKLQRYPEAKRTIDRVLRKGQKPWNAYAWSELATLEVSRGRNRRAILLLRKALKALPKWPTPYLDLADALTRESRLSDARDVLMAGKRATKNRAGEFLLKLSENARSRERLSEAKRWASKVLAIEPDCRAARIVLEDVTSVQ